MPVIENHYQYMLKHHKNRHFSSDIGDEIYTGGRLSDCHGDDNPCRAAMIDQVLVMMMVMVLMMIGVVMNIMGMVMMMMMIGMMIMMEVMAWIHDIYEVAMVYCTEGCCSFNF